MSERQQLALIKQLTEQKLSPDKPDCSPSVISPPRTPLGPLNSLGTNGASGPGTTPQEDKLLRKVSKKNHRGETPLHCSAIKVRQR